MQKRERAATVAAVAYGNAAICVQAAQPQGRPRAGSPCSGACGRCSRWVTRCRAVAPVAAAPAGKNPPQGWPPGEAAPPAGVASRAEPPAEGAAPTGTPARGATLPTGAPTCRGGATRGRVARRGGGDSRGARLRVRPIATAAPPAGTPPVGEGSAPPSAAQPAAGRVAAAVTATGVKGLGFWAKDSFAPVYFRNSIF
ncbi:uncharacterized protein LOC135604790 [Musa acuminata AAA Group]|uniref:uncharacterized protein LOC135604790 n=1 Tax=Musa acuminata AAA Group TaxID=214697 RepID=UPI0031E48825